MELKTIMIYFNSNSARTFPNVVSMEMVSNHQFKIVDWENVVYLINWNNVNFIVDMGNVTA